MPVPRTLCLYQNQADSTSPATEPGTAPLAVRAPSRGCEGCWIPSLGEQRTMTPRRKGWGRKAGGGWYFQPSSKIRIGCAGLGVVIQDQPGNCVFLVKPGAENPPTQALFPHQAARHSPSGVGLHGNICSFSSLAFLTRSKTLKKPLYFLFSSLKLFRWDSWELLCVSPNPKAGYQLIPSSKNITLPKQFFFFSPPRKQWVTVTTLQKYKWNAEITTFSSLPTVSEVLKLKR